MADKKISVYSIPGPYPLPLPSTLTPSAHLPDNRTDLKNTTDDALPNYLLSLKFTQSHYLADVRLTLGYSAVVIAAVTFVADYKLGWDATKAATFWAVLVYFVLNSAFTFWIWQVEKGVVFEGEKDGSKVCFEPHNLLSGSGWVEDLLADLTRSLSQRAQRSTNQFTTSQSLSAEQESRTTPSSRLPPLSGRGSTLMDTSSRSPFSSGSRQRCQ